MKSHSLVGRITLLQQLVAVLIVLSFAALALAVTHEVLVRQEDQVLIASAQRLAAIFDKEFSEEREPLFAAKLAALNVIDETAPGDVQVAIMDSSGRLLAATVPRAVSGANAAPIAVFSLIYGKAPASRASARTSVGVMIVTSMSSENRRRSMAALSLALTVVAIPLLLIALAVNRCMIRRALWPVVDMSNRARAAIEEQCSSGLGKPSGLSEMDGLRDAITELLRHREELLEAERRFTADAAHELRTPLTVLSGEVELALSNPDSGEGQRANLLRASEQIRGMEDLVESLLLLRRTVIKDRGPTGNFEPVNLSDIVREVTDEAILRAQPRKKDVLLEAPDEVLVRGIPTLLYAAVRNLVDNALKFTAQGEPVRIVVRGSACATVVVEDGGRGLKENERERVFDAFFRGAEARADKAGFGLGLPILRQVIIVHGGNVAADRSVLGGARFTVTLPLWSG